ncbi:MAG: hypothetical protein WDM77_03635 [Steroidobacteraceae bacterium]
MSNTFRISLMGGAAGLAVASVALADMSGLFGNTSVLFDRRNPEFVVKVQLFADGTYQTGVSGGFKTITTTGTWKEVDGKLCYTQISKPIPGTPTFFCSKGMDGKKVGDTWLERWDDGRMFKGRVVPGSN